MAGDERQTILLVPGLDGTALLFYRQIPLLERRFRVETHPLPNDPDCTMDSLVEDLHTWSDEQGLEKFLLCGESFGGALSMSFALAHPERLLGIVIVNSFPAIRPRWKVHLAPRLLRLIPWGAMQIVRRFTRHRLHSPHASREDLDVFLEKTRAIGRDGYIRRLEILQSYDIRDRLGELEVPALFLAGDHDKLVPSVREARFMAERVPQATLKILEGYGHICLIDHDLDLLEFVGPWLDGLSAG